MRTWTWRWMLRAVFFSLVMFSLLSSNLLRPIQSSPDAVSSLSLRFATIAELRAGLDSGQFTCKQLVEAYISRINQVNDDLRPVSQLSENAVSTAQDLDAELANKVEPRRPLHGIPVLIKDIISTTDDMTSSSGCTGLLDAKPRLEATVVRKLRDAGAVILGKTTASQWANFRSPGTVPSGWSATTGQCFGAFHNHQTPSGSSSGSAVAMSLGLAAVSLGTETHGSIINPASRAAVVGLKPTVGVVSRHGVYPVSQLQDTVGIMAISVLDAATVLNVIAGQDEHDPFTLKDPRDEHDVVRPQDYTEACASNDLRGLRIGVPRHVLNPDAVKAHHLNEALSVLSGLGATIVDNVVFSEFHEEYYENNKDEWECSFLVELRQNMKDYLAGFEKNPLGLHSLKDVMNYTAATPSEAKAEYGMEAWRRAERFSQETPPGSSKYHSSQERRRRMAKQIPELLDRTKCDLIVLTGATDTTAEVGGCPCLSVPLGRFPDDQKLEKNEFGHVSTGPNIPFGILFVGRRHSDMTLLKVGHAFEQATNARKSIKPVIEPEGEVGKDFKI